MNTEIYCSESNKNCILTCSDDYSCEGVIFNATNVSYAGVYVLDKNALVNAIVYSPISGDLKVFASNALENYYDSSSLTKFISNNSFHGNNTNSVYLECGGQGAGGNRIVCDKNYFYIENGNYLQVVGLCTARSADGL